MSVGTGYVSQDCLHLLSLWLAAVLLFCCLTQELRKSKFSNTQEPTGVAGNPTPSVAIVMHLRMQLWAWLIRCAQCMLALRCLHCMPRPLLFQPQFSSPGLASYERQEPSYWARSYWVVQLQQRALAKVLYGYG